MELSKISLLMKAKGFMPEQAGPNRIAFMYQGGNYYLDVVAEDKDYIRVGFPKFWYLDTERALQKGLQTANVVTEKVKAVKMYVIDADVYCSVEQFVRHEEDVTHFMNRYLHSLQGAVRVFAEFMAKND